MIIIQCIKHNINTLLIVVWLASILGCRDFKDHRTPYKSFVKIVFKPIKKDGKLPIVTIVNKTTSEQTPSPPFKETWDYDLILDSNADFVQLCINTTPTSSPKNLTIYYKREAVLISHQCGCAYKYIIKEIKCPPGMKLKIINKALSTFNDLSTDVQIFL